MRVFAFDHRSQLEDMARAANANFERIGDFKLLCLKAAQQVQAGRDGYGILCDQRLGDEALTKALDTGLWIGRPVELPGSRPIQLELNADDTLDDGPKLATWAKQHVVKVLVFCHPDDDAHMQKTQEERVIRLYHATRAQNLDFLLEVIPSKVAPVDDMSSAKLIQRFYDLGVRPEWWKLEPMKTDAGWQNACDAITRNDRDCKGIVVLGLDAPESELAASFAKAAKYDLVKGFAVGRSIFSDSAKAWLANQIDDATAVTQMAEKYAKLCEIWDASV